jgi:hypothetical protein
VERGNGGAASDGTGEARAASCRVADWSIENVRKKFTLPPSIFAKANFSFLNSKTGQNISLNF